MPSEQGLASSRHSGPSPGESIAFTCLYPLTGSRQGLALCSSYPPESPPRHLGRSELMCPNPGGMYMQQRLLILWLPNLHPWQF